MLEIPVFMFAPSWLCLHGDKVPRFILFARLKWKFEKVEEVIIVAKKYAVRNMYIVPGVYAYMFALPAQQTPKTVLSTLKNVLDAEIVLTPARPEQFPWFLMNTHRNSKNPMRLLVH